MSVYRVLETIMDINGINKKKFKRRLNHTGAEERLKTVSIIFGLLVLLFASGFLLNDYRMFPVFAPVVVVFTAIFTDLLSILKFYFVPNRKSAGEMFEAYLKKAGDINQEKPVEQVLDDILSGKDKASLRLEYFDRAGKLSSIGIILMTVIFIPAGYISAPNQSKSASTSAKNTSSSYDYSVRTTAEPTEGPAYTIKDDVITVYAGACTLENGVLTIPSEIEGQKVTAIDNLAFADRNDITSVVVPEGITSIGVGTFKRCSLLEKITLPQTLVSLGAEAFMGCTNLSECTLPPLLTELRARTFAGCSALEDITLPDGLVQLRAGVFADCSGLTHISLPGHLEEIDAEAFLRCTALEEIIMPDTVTKIGAYSFSGCTSLQKAKLPVHMPEGKISEYAFEHCSQLASISIPAGVTKISGHAFEGCTALSQVDLPGSLKTIGSSAFRRCKSLKSIQIPAGCSVDERAFKDSPTKITRK